MKSFKKHSMSGNIVLIIVFLICFFVSTSDVNATGTAAGTTITNQASASYSDASSNSYTANSNSVTTTVNAVYTVSVNTPTDKSGNSNTIVYYAYTVTNTGNNSNTFALSGASGGGGNTWTATLYFDANGDGVHDAGETTVTSSTGALAQDTSYKFFVAVTIPQHALNSQTDDTVLTVTGSEDAGAGDDTSDTVTTTAQAPALTITKAVRNVTTSGSFGATATANPTQTLEYRVTVANSGAVQATSVLLTDVLNANTTYVTGSIWIGSNGTVYNGSGNTNKTDSTSGDTSSGDADGAANYSGGTVTAYLGTGATESAGGSLAIGSTVYVYFRATVN